jgi:hypothetical protein
MGGSTSCQRLTVGGTLFTQCLGLAESGEVDRGIQITAMIKPQRSQT